MAAGGGSAVDPYEQLIHRYGFGQQPYDVRAGLTLVSLSSIIGSALGVYVIQGQSNSANLISSYTPTASNQLYNFNIMDGGIYRAAEPLVGTSGRSGSTWCLRFADQMVLAGAHSRILLVPIAIGGTFYSEWASGGIFNARMSATARRLSRLGITPNAILLQQGESDSLNSVSQADTTTALQSIISTWRSENVTRPIIISQSTSLSAASGDRANTRAAQLAVTGSGSVYLGPDTDTLSGATYRQGDNIHFTDTGLTSAATLWKNSVRSILGV